MHERRASVGVYWRAIWLADVDIGAAIWGGAFMGKRHGFGGIMIVTGPTVIAPLLRTARLSRTPATLLQWEAIVNDPIGALAAVLAFSVVSAWHTNFTAEQAIMELVVGIGFASVVGWAGGYGLARAVKRAWVPEYMKVPVLFALLLGVFAVSDAVLHESGLLAVTIMGIVIANSNLLSYDELR